MSNKSFAALLGSLLLACVAWMAYDLYGISESVRRDGMRRDLAGEGAGFGALVKYDFAFPTPALRHDLSTAEIERVDTDAPPENVRIPGLTVSKFNVEADYHFAESRGWFTPGVKMWVEDVTVHFGFTEVTVYVSNQYAEGSCAYRATLDHERGHVEADRRVWTDYQDRLRGAVRGAARIPVKGAPRAFATVEEGKREISAAVSSALDPTFDDFRRDIGEAQAVLDSPSSYAELHQRCPDW